MRSHLTPSLVLLLVAVGLASGPLGAQEDGLAGLLEERHRRKGFSGTVLVVRGGERLFERSYGLADLESGSPFTADTLFRVGSVTKPFTAAAVLLLENAGSLSVEDGLCRFLTPCPREWEAVEIRHLLSHTSGIPDLFGDVADAPVEETVAAIHEAIAAADELALGSSPGERYAYSNFGYLLLGAVIEAAGGRPECWRATPEPTTRRTESARSFSRMDVFSTAVGFLSFPWPRTRSASPPPITTGSSSNGAPGGL